jgi:hypothetical protein
LVCIWDRFREQISESSIEEILILDQVEKSAQKEMAKLKRQQKIEMRKKKASELKKPSEDQKSKSKSPSGANIAEVKESHENKRWQKKKEEHMQKKSIRSSNRPE